MKWVAENRGHDTPCWIDQGKPNNKGYPSSSRHVKSWEAEHGPVPEGLELDHLCRVRMCVRPSHMEAVTRAENCRRRTAALKSTCPDGHPYDGTDHRGHRICVECRRRADRARYHRRKVKSAP